MKPLLWENRSVSTPNIHPTAPILVVAAENVLFDMTAWRRWLVTLLHQQGFPATYPEFFDAWDRHFAGDVLRGRQVFREACREFLIQQGIAKPRAEEVSWACSGWRRRQEAEIHLLPGVRACLERLRGHGWRVAAVVNTDQSGAVLSVALERGGARQLLLGCMTSADSGMLIHEPEFVAHFLLRQGLDPTSVYWLCDDSLAIRGAVEVGFHAIGLGESPLPAELSVCDLRDFVYHMTVAPPHQPSATVLAPAPAGRFYPTVRSAHHN